MIARTRTRVKFCGMTAPDDVTAAVAAGADAIGIIVAPSARRVPIADVATIAAAAPAGVRRVGVLRDQGTREADALSNAGCVLQFCGDETPERCRELARGRPYLRVFHLDADAPELDLATYERYPDALWMFDTRGERGGGSGRTFAWQALMALARRRSIVVAGGLDAENVAACVATLAPYAVDVRSGIEADGVKSPRRMRAFAVAVRGAASSFGSSVRRLPSDGAHP